jgi:hypothetical protein
MNKLLALDHKLAPYTILAVALEMQLEFAASDGDADIKSAVGYGAVFVDRVPYSTAAI